MSLTVYLGYGYVKYAYYAYYFWPREKVEEHYVMPLRWQDIVTEVAIGSVLIGLLVGSVHLLRSAFRPKEDARPNFRQLS